MALDPVSAVAGGVGDIFKFATVFGTNRGIKLQGEADKRNLSINLVQQREAEREKSKRTMVYAGVGLFVVVIALVGVIVYVKNK